MSLVVCEIFVKLFKAVDEPYSHVLDIPTIYMYICIYIVFKVRFNSTKY